MTVTAVVKESLADYAHTAWSGWMKYLFEKSTLNEDGTMTIPKWAVDRWKRQVETPYQLLSDDEQENDLIEAEKMLEIVDPLPKLLIDSINRIFAEPQGCSLCDAGVPRNPEKGHQPDCPYELARLCVEGI